ncbi:S24 family peptidase [Lactococcus petauri]|uniref:S24 family peptidase n=1 Tax=Lactococcus petauri TaxID=1940789 RepID=UPI001F069E0B|nr:S24 family peptidase [Lactococcus petauri]MCH1713313.1 helix-turn-helix domain-containing protein [Lactococcus petauri]
MSGHLGNKEIMAENLQRYMNKYGLDRNDIAEIAGVSYFTVTAWLKARTYPRIDKIEILANHWNISKADLVEPENERPKPPTPIVEEITKISSQLEEPRQKIVLDTASSQLKEQKAIKREKQMLPFKKAQLDKISNLVPYDHDQEGFAPVIGEIAAGTPIFSEQNFEGMRPVYGKYAGRDDVFWLHVKGDSMESEIHDGSFALILLSPDIDDGAIGAVRFTDDNSATLKCVHYEYDDGGYIKRIRLEPLNPKYPIQYADESNPAEIAGRLVKVEQDY